MRSKRLQIVSLTSMNIHVGPQVGQEGESFVTDVTDVGSFPCVFPHVSCQVSSPVEHFTTDWALLWPLSLAHRGRCCHLHVWWNVCVFISFLWVKKYYIEVVIYVILYLILNLILNLVFFVYKYSHTSSDRARVRRRALLAAALTTLSTTFAILTLVFGDMFNLESNLNIILRHQTTVLRCMKCIH